MNGSEVGCEAGYASIPNKILGLTISIICDIVNPMTEAHEGYRALEEL
jgi:hypothetical protein